jgi:hypothetical protein
MRFYRYLIYRLYSSQLKIKDPNASLRVILILVIVHLCPLLAIVTILGRVSKDVKKLFEFSDGAMAVFMATAIALAYITIYNKKRWKKYLEEFNNESQSERKRGTILIRIYIWSCLLSLFVTFLGLAVFG